MTKSQFMIDHYREDDMIDVQCLWLQNEFKELEKARNEVKALKYQITGLQHKNDRLQVQLELIDINKPFKLMLDERA